MKLLRVIIALLALWQSAGAQIIPAGRVPNANAHPWSGMVGVEGGIPNSSNMTVSATISSGASAGTINAAIAACQSNQVVQLGAGTFTITSPILFSQKSGVVLRGAGVGITTIVASGNMNYGAITIYGPDIYPIGNGATVFNWTAGFTQGGSNIVLSSTSGLTVGKIICLDQINDGVDVLPYYTSSGGPADSRGGNRNEFQWCEVKAISGTTVTIWPPIANNNWNSANTPQAWFQSGTMPRMCGVENLTIDSSGQNSGNLYYSCLCAFDTWNCWAKNIRTVNAEVSHVSMYEGGRFEMRHCTMYLTQSKSSLAYGFQPFFSCWNLMEDCIGDTCVAPVQIGNGVGNSVLYSYFTNSIHSGEPTALHGDIWFHDGYNSFCLIEGNYAPAIVVDTIHQNGGYDTFFRNRVSANQAGLSSHRWAFRLFPYQFYHNVVGNVLGTSGVQTKEFGAIGSTDATAYDPCIYDIGYAVDGLPSDTKPWTTFFKNGNWDSANNAITWDASDSVRVIPKSLLYASKPAYFGSLNWPPYNPTNTSSALIDRTNIPAGYRYVFGVDPAAGGPSTNPPSITGNPVGVTNVTLFGFSISVGASGDGTLAYQWRLGGTPVSGATDQSYSQVPATAAQSGNYSCVVTSIYGTATSAPASVLITNPAVLPTNFSATAGIFSGAVSTSGGHITMTLDTVMNGTNMVSGQGQALYQFTNAATGNYVIQAVANGATLTNNSIYVAVDANPTEPDNIWNIPVLSGFTTQYVAWQGQGAFNSNSIAPLVLTNLTAGNHWLILRGRENGAQVQSFTVMPAATNTPVPPSITVQPADQTVTATSNAVFSVQATGDAPLSFQWSFAGTNIVGAIGSNYTRFNATAANAGNYQVVVANAAGSVTSSVAVLTVTPLPVPPSITTPPSNMTVAQGGNASFTVTATGTQPLRYTWTKTGVVLQSATGVSTFNTNGVSTNSAGTYTITITNVAGTTNASATLTVTVAPYIITQPQSVTIVSNGNASFTVNAGGAPSPTYQWSLGGVVIAGATLSTYTTNAVVAGGTYTVTLLNSSGSLTSGNAVLTVTNAVQAPVIASQPASITNVAGTSASLTVVASGTTLAYQWQFGGTNLAGATQGTYSMPSVATSNAGSYQVVITNSAGSVTSAVATVTVLVPPSITSQPQSRTNIAGTTASFDVTALGTAPLAYQWYSGNAAANLATNTTFSTIASTNNSQAHFSVVITNAGGSITSSAAILTVLVPPSFAAVAQSITNPAGNNLTLSCLESGWASPLPAYRWRYNGTPMTDSARISGSGTPSLILVNLTTNDGGSYSLVATNVAGAITSPPAILTVSYPPYFIIQPTNAQTVNANTTVTLSAFANGFAPVKYGWNHAGTNYLAPINNGSNITLFASAQVDGLWQCVATNSLGSATSSVSVLTVIIPPPLPRTLRIMR